MGLTVVITGALFVTSAVMCVAMAIAWASFGHPRHAHSWAWAFGCSAVQSLVHTGALLGGRSPLPMTAAFLLIVLPAPLVVIGARQRARRPTRWRWFAAAAVAESAFLVAAMADPALRPFGPASATVFSATCLYLAVAAIRPRGRPSEPAERAMMLALGLLGVVEYAVSALALLSARVPADAGLRSAYHAVLAVGLPPGVVCVGVAAILLVASDLAVELGRLAARDPLTGLFNRRGFQEGATRTLANARRLHAAVTVVLADIDHFKTINDRFGHSGGDHTLCCIADLLSQGVRQGDLVARIGGEEFALLLIDSDAAQASDAVERIRAAIEAGCEYDGVSIPVTASFGIGEIAPTPGDLAAIIARALDRADRALYLSKIQGRNRVTVAG